MTNPNALDGRWAEIIGLAWADDDFRRRLLADPKREMAAMGVDLGEANRVRVVEEADGETILVVPRKPAHIQAIAQAAAKKPAKSCLHTCTTCGKSTTKAPGKKKPVKKAPAKKAPAKKAPAKKKK